MHFQVYALRSSYSCSIFYTSEGCYEGGFAGYIYFYFYSVVVSEGLFLGWRKQETHARF
jgi:hypothetical protein